MAISDAVWDLLDASFDVVNGDKVFADHVQLFERIRMLRVGDISDVLHVHTFRLKKRISHEFTVRF